MICDYADFGYFGIFLKNLLRFCYFRWRRFVLLFSEPMRDQYQPSVAFRIRKRHSNLEGLEFVKFMIKNADFFGIPWRSSDFIAQNLKKLVQLCFFVRG